MNQFEEWDATRRYLIDRVTAAQMRVQRMVQVKHDGVDLRKAQEELATLNEQLTDHERKAP